MKSASICLLVALAILIVLPLAAQEPWWEADASKAPVRQREHSTALKAYRAFGAGDYNRALRILDRLSVSPDERTSLETLKRIWGIRRELGDITPEVVFKALVINLNRMDVVMSDGRRVTRTMTEEEKRQTELYLAMTSKTYEAFSRGRMTIAFDVVYIETPFVGLTYPTSGGMEFPRLDTVPGLPELLRRRVADCDLLVIHSPRGVTGTALGGVWAVPYIEYGLYGPRRGRLILNTIHDYGVWVHETFHSLEGQAGISPIHGYYSEPRKQFPEWHGVSGDQFDYFDWQFSTTLADYGYENLLFRNRYPDPTPDDVFAEALDLYAGISPGDKYRADELYWEGRSSRDPEAKEGLLKQAIALSPLHSSAHWQLADLYMGQGRYEEALDHYLITATHFPRPSMYLGAGRAERKLGDVDLAMEYFRAGLVSPAGDGIEANRGDECACELASLLNDRGQKQEAFDTVLDTVKAGGRMSCLRELMVRYLPSGTTSAEALDEYYDMFDRPEDQANFLMQVAVREHDRNRQIELFERAGSMLLELRSAGKVPDRTLGDYYFRAGELYLGDEATREKAYEYAKKAIENGYVYTRSIELLVNAMPREYSIDRAMSVVDRIVADESRRDQARKLLDQRMARPAR